MGDKPKIHYSKDGKCYRCSMNIPAYIDRMTMDKSKVTCKFCLHELETEKLKQTKPSKNKITFTEWESFNSGWLKEEYIKLNDYDYYGYCRERYEELVEGKTKE